jgi:hypothetical protein
MSTALRTALVRFYPLSVEILEVGLLRVSRGHPVVTT